MPGAAQSQATETLFDIPAQPLDSALEAYMRATGLQGFYKSASTMSLTSHAVKGRFTSEEALEMLLAGTDLAARYPIEGTFTIVAPSSERDALSRTRPPPLRITAYNTFLGLVQGQVIASLCGNPATRPGSYRAALQISIGAAGVIDDASLLSTTGDVARDRVIADALLGVNIGEAPPPTMPQPVTMLISPRRPGAPDGCRDRLSPGSFADGRD